MTHAHTIATPATRPALFIGDAETFTKNGVSFTLTIEADADACPPWENCDGHGHVSDWVNRDKKPGEIVLSHDGSFKRFYDIAETMRTARRDGWGLSPEAMAAFTQRMEYKWRNRHNRGRLSTLPELAGPMAKPTRGQIVAEAVRLDFEHLHGWCLDRWQYVGVCVHATHDADADKYAHAVWGIESTDSAYMRETAENLAADILAEAEEKRKKWGRYVVCTEGATGGRLNVTTYATGPEVARDCVLKAYPFMPESVIKAIYQVNENGFLVRATGPQAGELYRVTPPAEEIRKTEAPRNPYATGYGEAVPTGYKIKGSRGQWLRVYCRIFSNSGTLWARHPSGYRVAIDLENA